MGFTKIQCKSYLQQFSCLLKYKGHLKYFSLTDVHAKKLIVKINISDKTLKSQLKYMSIF